MTRTTPYSHSLQVDPFMRHQHRIARDTLKMSDAGAAIMGGMTKEEARRFLSIVAGMSAKQIAALEAA